jgi:hypothetical protein
MSVSPISVYGLRISTSGLWAFASEHANNNRTQARLPKKRQTYSILLTISGFFISGSMILVEAR